MEPGVQTPEQTLTLGQGSCRDSAWLLVQVLRRLGVASRFVSGYLVQLTPDQRALEGPTGPEKDFTDLHAWCECFLPGAGWVGLDPTSGLFTAEGHIPLAATPNPSSAAPVSGGVEKVETEFEFDMSVTRVVDRARVTRPYSDAQWDAILALGDRVDEGLREGDVRLSTGSEPSFVSSESPDAPEWNIAALGGRKQEIADRPTRRLMKHWAPGGVLHHGQGKWYPGEQLPRWAYSCFYRTDGHPLWHDESLIAASDRDYGHDATAAARFAGHLAGLLGLTRHRLIDAYEDVWYALWRERRLPTNVDPFDSRLEDPIERARLARIFEQGLDRVVGWVLPLEHADEAAVHLLDPYVERAPLPREFEWPRPASRSAREPRLQFEAREQPAADADAAGYALHAPAGSAGTARASGPPRASCAPRSVSKPAVVSSRSSCRPRNARCLRRTRRRNRTHRSGLVAAGATRGLPGTPRSAARRIQDHAGSGRDRGERAAHHLVA